MARRAGLTSVPLASHEQDGMAHRGQSCSHERTPRPSSFRTMTESEISEVLAVDVPARLATLDSQGHPYITPLWYVFADGAFIMTSVADPPPPEASRPGLAGPGLRRPRVRPRGVDGQRANARVRGRGGGVPRSRRGLDPADHASLHSRRTGAAPSRSQAAMDRYVIRMHPERLIALGTPPSRRPQ
jgi:hypothetical protein